MPQRLSPTVRRRELGALLRRYRREAGLTVKDVTEKLLCSPTKISRMETGQRAVTLRDVRDLSLIYGLKDQQIISHLMNLAREGRQHGWWQRLDIEPELATLVGFETAATAISQFATIIVPGLLQSREYAYAAVRALRPHFTKEQTEETVQARMVRQRILRDTDAPHYWSILDEAVFRRPIGGKSAMREQLERLVEMAELQRVTIQVVPFETGAHAALDSSFVLLDFDEPVNSVIYVENLAGQLYLEHPNEIARFRKTLDRLKEMVRSPEDSLAMIQHELEELDK
jgi:transcriptional regulator with XRE-family HTH domain